MKESEPWDSHWTSASKGSLFERLASMVRTRILSRAVRDYSGRYFPSRGVFLECGCGTGQSSSRIPRSGRHLVALDFSLPALQAARTLPTYTEHLQGDIRRLPFANDSISGIWNLGVMEHFEPNQAMEILAEFRRVLRPGHVAILFWPPNFGSSRWILAPIERFLSWKRGRLFRFFPDEVNRLRSRSHAFATIKAADLEPLAVDFTFRDFFIHLVVVCRKPNV